MTANLWLPNIAYHSALISIRSNTEAIGYQSINTYDTMVVEYSMLGRLVYFVGVIIWKNWHTIIFLHLPVTPGK